MLSSHSIFSNKQVHKRFCDLSDDIDILSGRWRNLTSTKKQKQKQNKIKTNSKWNAGWISIFFLIVNWKQLNKRKLTILYVLIQDDRSNSKMKLFIVLLNMTKLPRKIFRDVETWLLDVLRQPSRDSDVIIFMNNNSNNVIIRTSWDPFKLHRFWKMYFYSINLF